MAGLMLFMAAIVLGLLNFPGVKEGELYSMVAMGFCFAAAIVNLILGIKSLN